MWELEGRVDTRAQSVEIDPSVILQERHSKAREKHTYSPLICSTLGECPLSSTDASLSPSKEKGTAKRQAFLST